MDRKLLSLVYGKGTFSEIEAVLKQGADPNTRDSMNWSVLMHAEKFGKVKIYSLLVKYGAKAQHVESAEHTTLGF